jgi:hypothetical protein
MLVALWIALAPFGWRDPYRSAVSCSPAAVAMWQTTVVSVGSAGYWVPETPAVSGYWSYSLGNRWVPARPAVAGYRVAAKPTVYVPTACALAARRRLETAGLLLGLTVIGLVVGRRILGVRIPSTDGRGHG